jgi:signal transduction histidine kinase
MRPRARLISLIGEELISDEPVALVELVKNSYDADATSVEVRFEGKDPNSPERIVVTDNGLGMDLDTVLNAWFEPGTSTKRKSDRSPGGRLYQGAKGIGRFAAARLARSLFLESKRPSDEYGVVVLLDWGAFGDEGYLDEISIDYEERSMGSFSGTRLILEGLRKEWTEDDYEQLYDRLSRMISPFAGETDAREVSDFKVVLDIPSFPDFSRDVSPPELISQPKYVLKGSLNGEGVFSGEILYNTETIKVIRNEKLGGKDATPLCGSFDVEIRAWDRDREGLEPISARLNLGLQEIRRTLNRYCGVSIYRDGFRVYPYGQSGNDWLKLDNRSRQNPPRRLANNQIVAAIRISRSNNPELKDRSNREGMILNAEHKELEEWFVEVLSLLEDARYNLRPRWSSTSNPEPLFEPFDLSIVLRQARSELGEDHPVVRVLTETEDQLKSGVERVQEVFSRLLMSAGLGQMVDIVIHEIGAPVGRVNRELALLERNIQGFMDEKTGEQLKSIKSWLEQIGNLRQRLDPQTPGKRGRATVFNVKEEIDANFRLYDALIMRQKINWHIDAPEEAVEVKMSRAALGQILANLIDNSIFWIMRHKGIGKGGEIQVRLERLETGFKVTLSDDGSGVPEEDQASIFEPYFTKKPNGIGLGLYIARLVIEPYGKLIYRDDCDLPGACFEASFQAGVGL